MARVGKGGGKGVEEKKERVLRIGNYPTDLVEMRDKYAINRFRVNRI